MKDETGKECGGMDEVCTDPTCAIVYSRFFP